MSNVVLLGLELGRPPRQSDLSAQEIILEGRQFISMITSFIARARPDQRVPALCGLISEVLEQLGEF